MTVVEHFKVLCRIKGLNKEEEIEQSDFIITSLNLEDYRNIKAKNLSGGNKRKLCCGLSLITAPLLCFLDESTTGVDPVSRKSLWSAIKSFASIKSSSYVFTTHWMSEAESLCNRVIMLINGKILCVGSPQQLRNIYGSGYNVSIIKNINFD